ncbi:formylmethanofuran dehydrogenase subunit E [Desulfocicer vacuolatum DSM 3385]|uniref:Formylmethanofuran dehydrogenase subunit E n=1 Tax=Desulfocicer vacuolatum DSM 3385 TaxID=1121400 RepID=A0A1W1ZWD8_9BACT|nr:FmdE family protein [Desulfocicer vacuolatum]SMC52724.1 formylmethanofuran dehydrogenase subunit E [Desulfocicer vacuolatum DSM 3385]
MKSFKSLLDASVIAHGHLCAGQVIGVRMAMLGCRLVGIDDPTSPQFKKKLIVYVEMDRCASDAIGSVTGCRLGKRTLKFKDYGINAATFVNLETRKAVRIVSTEASRELVKRYAPEEEFHYQQQIKGYRIMPENELFEAQWVSVDLPGQEMPGPPRTHTTCTQCGQVVRDAREVIVEGKPLCRICAGEGYFKPEDPVIL